LGNWLAKFENQNTSDTDNWDTLVHEFISWLANSIHILPMVQSIQQNHFMKLEKGVTIDLEIQLINNHPTLNEDQKETKKNECLSMNFN
jgi:hypothetical protein